MRRKLFNITGVIALGLVTMAAGERTVPEIGKPAPNFTLPDTRGAQHSLEQYRGKWVVLEWTNYGCPYVRKHYRTGNLPTQQKKWRDQGVVWLAVASSAPGEQGYYEPAAMDVETKTMNGKASAVLLDPAGKVGRAYDARTTPHMYVIDPKGNIVYMGGIDDVPSPRYKDLERAKQLVDIALQEATAGRPVTTPTSRPYGCNVKYL